MPTINSQFDEVLMILYVSDQEKSKKFYAEILGIHPELHVPGMTEFRLNVQSKLGLMPNTGISNIICPILPSPELAKGIPRCEIYLKTKEANAIFNRAKKAGAKIIQEFTEMDWGDEVCYFADPDGHVVALAIKP